jgi:hypothetical protein
MGAFLDMQATRARTYRARKTEARVEGDDRKCRVCGGSMKGRRADAVVCSTKCRMRGHRHLGSLKSLALDPKLNRYKGTDGRSLAQREELAIAIMRMPAESAELTEAAGVRRRRVQRGK